MKTDKVILLVDDDPTIAKNLAELSLQSGIITTHKTNYQDMSDSLPKLYNKLTCIVLDIYCLIDKDQKIERADFLGKAISYLDQNYKAIPRVILTSVPSGYEDVKKYFSREKVFMKTLEGLNEMLAYVKSLDTESVKIRSQYSDVFEIVEKSPLTIETETQIIDLIKKLDSKDHSEILDNLAKIRRIQESIFQTINKANKNILPDNLFKENKDIKFWDIHKHLQGNPSRDNGFRPTSKVYYTGIIANFSEVLYKVSSDNGSHNPFENKDYNPTNYSVKTLTNALMDFIRWFGTLKLSRM